MPGAASKTPQAKWNATQVARVQLVVGDGMVS
jgi:hypothetical protein